MYKYLVMAALLFGTALPSVACAVPKPYQLDKAGSVVAFTWFFGKDAVKGTMPVKRADLVLDFDHAANSTVDVAMDVAASRAGFAFATQAMKGPKILDAGHFPEITFRSRRVVARSDGADVHGDLTIRGVTRPAVFRAQLYKATRQDSDLTVLLTGSVDRHEFGADGWPDMAGSEVRFEVLAHLRRTQ